MRCPFRALVALMMLGFFTLAAWGAGAAPPVRIGVLAWQGLEEAEIRWSSLMNQLEEHLPGRTLAAASVDAFGGYQILWAELRRLGLDPEQGQPRPVLTGFPMAKVVESVLNGDADAGVLRACLLEHLEQEGALRPGQLRVLSPRADMSRCRGSSRL